MMLSIFKKYELISTSANVKGLSISKAYVEMLDGELWIESEKGVGSTFYFTIPLIEKSEFKEQDSNFRLN